MLAHGSSRRQRSGKTILPAILLLLTIHNTRIQPRTIRRRNGKLPPFVLTPVIEATTRPPPLLLVHAVEGVAVDVVFLPVDMGHADYVLGAGYAVEGR